MRYGCELELFVIGSMIKYV